MDTRLKKLFTEYDQYHLDPINRLTHKIGIPLIFFNAIAMLDWIKLIQIPGAVGTYLTVAHFVIAAFCLWYLSMSLKLGVMLVIAFGVFLAIGWITPVWLVIGAGVAGWVLQMLGHLVWEKKAPNFTKNSIQAVVGPIYFLALSTGDWSVPDSKSERTQAARTA